VASSAIFNSASGTASVSVSQAASTPTVTVTPASNTILTTQSLSVAIAVAGAGATPTGSVVLSSGSYTSLSTALSSGSATIAIPAGSLATGTDTLTAKYTPDSGSSSTYNSASGTTSVTVSSSATAITVNINALANRHQISPFVYGNNDGTISDISDVGYTLSRFGGNDASNFNWTLQARNAAGDYYFEDYGNAGDPVQQLTNTLMREPGSDDDGHDGLGGKGIGLELFRQTFGPQCSVDPYNTDAGSGTVAGSTGNCGTSTNPVTTSPVTTAYYPLVDTAAACRLGRPTEPRASTAKPGQPLRQPRSAPALARSLSLLHDHLLPFL